MLSSFLARHGMAPEQVDLARTCDGFLSEMTAGLAQAPSSILMLPTYLSHDGPLPLHVPVAVIDAGGTNARVAKVTLTEDGPLIQHLEVFPMPGSLSEVSREEFFHIFSQKLLPFIEDCASVGFCFSFPAQITSDRDGKVLYFDKEVKVTGSVGMMLMEGLSQALTEKGVPSVRGVVLNDTVAAFLGGLTQTDRSAWDGFLGLIYGTGINLCYAEPISHIAALSSKRQGSMLINTESGSFSQVPSGEYDRALDAATKDPGHHLYEKMVAGAYLGEVIRRTIGGAVQEGLLPSRFAQLDRLATWQADAFVVDPLGDNPLARLCQTVEEQELVYQIIDRLTLRAARLVCANLAAVMIKADLGRHAEKPACIIVEGSTFYKSKLLRPHLETVMEEFIRDKLERHYAFLKPENANLMGSAAAALLNP